MNEMELIEKLKAIKQMGFVRSHRYDDTGIGKTLEDLLGIQENNLKLPDLGNIEIKAKRAASSSMLTIATKQPSPQGSARNLFDVYGYPDEHGAKALHITVSGSQPNAQGFQLILKEDRIEIRNPKNIPSYYPTSLFDDVLATKSNTIVLVFADSRGNRKQGTEEFYYYEAYKLANMNKNKFLMAIQNDKLKVDFRIGSFKSGINKGKFHDHGTGLRIMKRDFMHIFDNYQQIM